MEESFLLNGEPFLSERMEKAKELAARIVNKDHRTIQDSMLFLKSILSRHYNIPIFHEYFEKRTFEELVFEIELINLSNQSNVEKGKNILQNNKKEAESLFDDMAEDDEFKNVEFKMSDDEFSKITNDFMNTGNFKGDK